MLIPYSTDAPIYHVPFSTIGLIVVNVIAFFWSIVAGEAMAPYVLILGDGIHPEQWFTHMFLHAGIGHLLGNMVFLWGFGLVVEGKIGWFKFLWLYLIIGALVGMIIQLGMLEAEITFALGASAAIFGIVGVASIWSPKADMHFVWFIYFRPFLISVPVLMVSLWYVLWDIGVLWFTDFSMSGATGHVLGAILGLFGGFTILKRGWVDCEGYDILSIARGREGEKYVDPRTAQREKEERIARKRIRAEQTAEDLAQVHVFLQNKNILAAIKLMEAVRQRDKSVQWELSDLRLVIAELLRAEHWQQAALYMDHYLEHWSDGATEMRLMLAKVLVVKLARPAKAIRVLRELPLDELTSDQRDLVRLLAERAHAIQSQGVVELSDD
jgi:membrane associated rhomboid family serine protease